MHTVLPIRCFYTAEIHFFKTIILVECWTVSNKIEQEFQQKKEPVRLNKYLSEAGVCSRREADRLIESGRVSVDGKRAETGMRILPGQVVRVGKKSRFQTG